MESWEYKVVKYTSKYAIDVDEAELNELGDDGWELVGVVNDVDGDIATANPSWVSGRIRTAATLIFKRSKS